MMTETATAVEILGLEKHFRGFSLGPMDLRVPQGAIYGLIGPNGAGKTTAINLIMGMCKKDAGSIRVFGMDHVAQEAEVKKKVGYVNPELILWPWGRVYRLINFVRFFYSDWDDAYCEDLLRRLHIGPDEKIHTLSFGARIKLGLVLALSHRPALLLLDEPLAGLDAVSRQEIFDEILAAVQDEHRSVLISSHDLHDLERVTDHIGFLHQGRMVLEGQTSDIVDRYRQVNAMAQNGRSPGDIAGIRVLQRDEKRYRMLVDTEAVPLDRLAALGFTPINVQAVTLEELFVMLVKES